MKKFLNFIRSPKSDFVLLVILLLLINLVARKAFVRLDLTSPKSYTLSKASKELVRTLSSPLSVRVFFSDGLRSPYNATQQYVEDVLSEYKANANKNFSYAIMDMKGSKNDELAANYGLRQIQLQQVSNNEIGFSKAYMGLVISYGDNIETLDALTSSDGFEYKLTTKMSNMISKAASLSMLSENEKLNLNLYLNNELFDFNIAGFSEIENLVQDAVQKLNEKNANKISFQKIIPNENEIASLQEKYGIQIINWQNKNTSGKSALGVVLSYKNNFRTIPLTLERGLFGYMILGLDDLETTIESAIQSLLSKASQLGYITGHDETPLYSQSGEIIFSKMLSDLYELKELNLAENEIPQNINTIIVNSPKKSFSEKELYALDQFILRGGNAVFFLDAFDAVIPQGQKNNPHAQPSFQKIDTGLEKLFSKWGFRVNKNYVYDETCYTTYAEQYGKISLYWAPEIHQKNLAKSPITNNLGALTVLQNSSINLLDEKPKDAKLISLAKSSEKSWTVSENIQLNPLMVQPPYDKTIKKSEALSLLAEGKFESAFENSPSQTNEKENTNANKLSANAHLSHSVLPSRIIVVPSSLITSEQLIDENFSTPTALFVRNTIDYATGNADMCLMRTKGRERTTLDIKNPHLALLSQYFNEFGLAILVVLAGLLAWRNREKRKIAIRKKYNPNDTRVSK